MTSKLNCDNVDLSSIQEAPNASSSRLLARNVNDVRGQAQILPGAEPGTYSLVVAGYKPYANMDVELLPLIYVAQPDYWGIEVVGTIRSGIVLPATIPFATEPLLLANVTGKKGIEVIWADEKQQIDIASSESSGIATFADAIEIFAEYEVAREGFRYPCPKWSNPFRTCPADVVIRLKHPRLGEVIGKVRECVRGAGYAAAVAALIAAIISSGVAVTEAAAGAFKAYLVGCLLDKGVSFAKEIEVKIDIEKK